MSKITPCLWFDTEAEEAANFYVSLFPNAKIVDVTHYGEAGPRPVGMVMTVEFSLDGQDFTALNGGPDFTFNEAVSFQVDCDDAGRARQVLVRPVRGRRGRAVRVAEGQVRRLLADHPHRLDRAGLRPGHREGTAGDQRHAADGQARHRGAAEGGSRVTSARRSSVSPRPSTP